MQIKNFHSFIGSFALLVALHIAAQVYSFYYLFPAFDSGMHILGGLAFGFLGLAWIPGTISRRQRILYILGFVLIIAIGWEIMERVGNVFAPQYLGYGGRIDTLCDIAYGILGGLVAILISRNK